MRCEKLVLDFSGESDSVNHHNQKEKNEHATLVWDLNCCLVTTNSQNSSSQP